MNTIEPIDTFTEPAWRNAVTRALNALVAAHNERVRDNEGWHLLPSGHSVRYVPANEPASLAEKLRRDPEGADEADLHEWSPQFQEQLSAERRRIEAHE